jgi:uncharacterized alkaline shock family protein YloU
MTDQTLTVGRGVIAQMARLAAFEVPGVQHVGRAGPPWRRFFLGPAVTARVRDGRVSVRVAIVARPGQPLEPLADQVRSAVGAAVERLLGLELEGVIVLVDGVGG